MEGKEMNQKWMQEKAYYLLPVASILLFLGAWTYVSGSNGGLIPTPKETFVRFI